MQLRMEEVSYNANVVTTTIAAQTTMSIFVRVCVRARVYVRTWNKNAAQAAWKHQNLQTFSSCYKNQEYI